MSEPQAPEPGAEHDSSPAASVEEPPSGRWLMVNLVGAIGAGTLSALLADAMPGWPRSPAFALVYVLMLPFLLIPPLWTLVGLLFAVRILRSGAVLHGRWLPWTGVLTGAIVAALAWPPYFRGLWRLI